MVVNQIYLCPGALDGVKVMLAGGIGGGAINVLNNKSIEVIRGCWGKADDIV